MSFDAESMRKVLNNALAKKNLKIADIEKKAGLSRASLYNFLVGKVREPRLEVIIAAIKLLEIDPAKIFELDFAKKFDNNEKKYDLPLLLECSQAVIKALIKRGENLSPEQIFAIIQKVHAYSSKYTGQKLDAAFLEWSIDNTLKSYNISQCKVNVRPQPKTPHAPKI